MHQSGTQSTAFNIPHPLFDATNRPPFRLYQARLPPPASSRHDRKHFANAKRNGARLLIIWEQPDAHKMLDAIPHQPFSPGAALTNMHSMSGSSYLARRDTLRVGYSSKLERNGDEYDGCDDGGMLTSACNSTISALVANGHHGRAILCFSDMLRAGELLPTDRTFVNVMTACASTADIGCGRAIHGMTLKRTLSDQTRLSNCLITLYARCGDLESASRVFETMEEKDTVSWNAIIAGHERNLEFELAIRLFHRMVLVGSSVTVMHNPTPVEPSRVTYITVLGVLSSVSALKLGREVHAKIIRSSGLESDATIGNSLIAMYAKCKAQDKARIVFEQVLRRGLGDAVTWNSMLSAYACNDQPADCFNVFKRMQSSGIQADRYCLTILLSVLSDGGCCIPSECLSRLGREIHCHVLRRALASGEYVPVYNAVLTMYARNRAIGAAECVFQGIIERDSYTWNAMMEGYADNGLCIEALMIFISMLEQSKQPPDSLAFTIIFTANSRFASIHLGEQLHALCIKFQRQPSFQESALRVINNALVSMYSKCGSIDAAARVFELMEFRDVFSWTSMITGLAHHGMASESIKLFQRMVAGDGVEPNSVTFLGLLTSCAHTGLVEEGAHYFNSMSKDYCIEPGIEHYACMVDLFARRGQFKRAVELIDRANSTIQVESKRSTVGLWKALLAGCHAHKQLELGIRAAEIILEMEPEDDATHVLLSNLYAAFGLWSDAANMRKLMEEKGLRKEAGHSWMVVGNKQHLFVAGDSRHPDRKDIYEKLRVLNEKFRSEGYTPLTDHISHDVEDSEKEGIVASHSEKLAVSFALLQNTTGRKETIRVIKNLRICVDCHNWMKFASRLEGRCEIVLRDCNRFHHFKGGRCSCGDYW